MYEKLIQKVIFFTISALTMSTLPTDIDPEVGEPEEPDQTLSDNEDQEDDIVSEGELASEDDDLDADSDIPIEDDDGMQSPEESEEEGPSVEEEEEACSLSDDEDLETLADSDPLRTHVGLDYFEKIHPESRILGYEEVLEKARVTRNKLGIPVDDGHKTLPTLTRYEYARAQGTRAAQINGGSPPLVDVPAGIIDGLTIAAMEIEAKKCPLIIRRPLPGGTAEYWHLRDLEMVNNTH